MRRRVNLHPALLCRFHHLSGDGDPGLGIFLKGVGIDVLWRPAALMTAVGLVVFGFGLVRFRRQLG